MSYGLGIDFGGVIAERILDGENHPAELPPEAVTSVPHAFEVIADMNELLRGRVWIVSKASPGTQRMTRSWLEFHHFAEITGVRARQVHFVRDRSGKLDIARELGITHFVDDRLENLQVLLGQVEHLYLFGCDRALDDIVAVPNWVELGHLIRQSVLL